MSIRVLVVDDSALARKMISDCLAADPAIEVIGTASSAEAAWNRMQRMQPDVITLDAVMEPVDGVSFLRDFMSKMPTPTVLVSSMGQRGTKTSVAALAAGALSVVAKPDSWSDGALDHMKRSLCQEVKAAARSKRLNKTQLPNPGSGNSPTRPCSLGNSPSLRAPTALEQDLIKSLPPASLSLLPAPHPRPKLIAIGASTGGAAALSRILPMFKAGCPPIMIVDHMPEGFTREFAERLNERCAIRVLEATDHLLLEPGMAVIGPGGPKHLELSRDSIGRLYTSLVAGEKINGHRPSVNVLFRSVARELGSDSAAALLTGMGRDGAEGLLVLRRAGSHTTAQDEASSVVFGMPKAAIELGAAEHILPLDLIPRHLPGGS